MHAWLLEDLSEGRVRILTQESQKGKPAAELFESEPDTMNIGHQKWVKGLARTVLAAKAAKEAQALPCWICLNQERGEKP